MGFPRLKSRSAEALRVAQVLISDALLAERYGAAGVRHCASSARPVSDFAERNICRVMGAMMVLRGADNLNHQCLFLNYRKEEPLSDD